MVEESSQLWNLRNSKMIGNIFKFVGKWKSSNHSTEQLKIRFSYCGRFGHPYGRLGDLCRIRDTAAKSRLVIACQKLQALPQLASRFLLLSWKTRGKKACSTRYVESILMIKSYLLFSFTGRQFTEVPQTVSRPWNKVLWGRYSNRTLNISPFSSVPCPLYAPHASGRPFGAHRTLHSSVVCVKRQRSGLYME